MSDWTCIDLHLRVREPLEIRAQPDKHGGWTIRAERSVGDADHYTLGMIKLADQTYAFDVT